MPLERQIWDVMDNRFTKVTPETPLKEACALLTGLHGTKPGGAGAGGYAGQWGISGRAVG